MLTRSQYQVLKSYFGSEGNFSLTILEDNTIDASTKIIYLQRALKQPLHLFLASLDILYNDEFKGHDQQNHLELIRCLKLINDLKFNHEIRFGIYGNKLARDHFFNMLGELESNAFEKMLTKLIKRLKGQIGLQNNPLLIRKNCQIRLSLEYDTPPNIEWRSKLILPSAQQVLPKSACASFCLDLFTAISHFGWLLSPLFYMQPYQDINDEALDEAAIEVFEDEAFQRRLNV